jgi:hypothetical protein
MLPLGNSECALGSSGCWITRSLTRLFNGQGTRVVSHTSAGISAQAVRKATSSSVSRKHQFLSGQRPTLASGFCAAQSRTRPSSVVAVSKWSPSTIGSGCSRRGTSGKTRNPFSASGAQRLFSDFLACVPFDAAEMLGDKGCRVRL